MVFNGEYHGFVPMFLKKKKRRKNQGCSEAPTITVNEPIFGGIKSRNVKCVIDRHFFS